ILCPFLLTAPPTTPIYTLSLHDALPISIEKVAVERLAPVLSVGDRLEAERFLHDDRLLDASILVSAKLFARRFACPDAFAQLERSEEHTSELQSRENLVCRLLLEKKKIT